MEKRAKMYLKSKNIWKVWGFIFVNVMIFWSLMVLDTFDFVSVKEIIFKIDFKQSLLACLFPVLTIVLNSIIKPSLKEILVFWHIKNPLPGSRAFTELSPKDTRIDITKLRNLVGEFPDSPQEQNQLWYRLYKKHMSKPTIEGYLQDYLLTRDLTALSFLFLVVFGIAIWLINTEPKIKLIYAGLLIGQYLITRVAAKNNGERLVCNVLAEESVGS